MSYIERILGKAPKREGLNFVLSIKYNCPTYHKRAQFQGKYINWGGGYGLSGNTEHALRINVVMAKQARPLAEQCTTEFCYS